MAAAASRVSAKSTLTIGSVEVEVGLFSTRADPKSVVKFETAGPNGGVLKTEQRAVEVAVEEQDAPDVPVQADPLAEDPLAPAPLDPAKAEDYIVKAQAANAAGAELLATESVQGEYRQVLVEEGTGETVLPEDVRRGVRLDDGRFIDLTEQVEAIDERTKLDKMAVVSFIDVGQVQRERVVGSYFVGGETAAEQRPLRLIYEAMKATRRAAVVKWTKRSRQSLGVIVAHGPSKTLVLLELVWQEDFREAPARARNIAKATVTEAEVAAASELIAALSDTRQSLDELRDDAIALRVELRQRAEAGEMDAEVVEPLSEPPPGTTDLLGALQASVEAVRA